MLGTDTKRRIDTACDLLIGKVPDPKRQVEQITIALIYKFMDDMDAEAEELGGRRKFFAGEFARYGWAKLMRAGLGGHETLNLCLHGFSDPHIAEYDTVTSQDRWNEHADVILANPPFMSPKGGLRPHNRFSVPSAARSTRTIYPTCAAGSKR